jgi:hypothetical protein
VVVDLCQSCFCPATLPREKTKIKKLWGAEREHAN